MNTKRVRSRTRPHLIPRNYAEIENTQRRGQALQENCHRQSEAGAFGSASHADVEGAQTQTQTGYLNSRESGRSPQSEADDPLSVKSIAVFVIADC